MRLEKRQLVDLKPAAYNPRKALKPGDDEYEKLAASIERHGYIDPIVINEDGTIIGGHQRRTVMMDLGYTEAEVIIVDLPDKNDEIAAEQLGRIAYLMEISPKYCDVIIDRWEEYTGKKAIRVRGGDMYGG